MCVVTCSPMAHANHEHMTPLGGVLGYLHGRRSPLHASLLDSSSSTSPHGRHATSTQASSFFSSIELPRAPRHLHASLLVLLLAWPQGLARPTIGAEQSTWSKGRGRYVPIGSRGAPEQPEARSREDVYPIGL